MARLFLGNFDFEHRLAHPNRQPTTNLKRLNAELATAWVSIAKDGDWIWTPEPINTGFFREMERLGLPKVVPVTILANVPRDIECVPWGWSSEVRQLVERFGWTANPPKDAAVRLGNSRATSYELEKLWGVGLDGAARIESLDQLKATIDSLQSKNSRWVVKAEFGMSGRERVLGCGPMKTADENWVLRRLSTGGGLFFEPWVDRVEELGIQIEIPENDSPVLVGLTPILVNARGQYAGSWFQTNKSQIPSENLLVHAAIEVALRAAKHLQANGYFGPIGIDAMLYRNHDGLERIRPLQDINARWTMGRLSLGWRRFLTNNQSGVWQHSSIEHGILPKGISPLRTIETTPLNVGNQPCHHSSRVVIFV